MTGTATRLLQSAAVLNRSTGARAGSKKIGDNDKQTRVRLHVGMRMRVRVLPARVHTSYDIHIACLPARPPARPPAYVNTLGYPGAGISSRRACAHTDPRAVRRLRPRYRQTLHQAGLYRHLEHPRSRLATAGPPAVAAMAADAAADALQKRSRPSRSEGKFESNNNSEILVNKKHNPPGYMCTAALGSCGSCAGPQPCMHAHAAACT